MSTMLVAKHIIWLTGLRKERMTIPFGFFAVISDAIFEAIETVTSTFASDNPFFSPKLLYLGAAMHVPTVLLELASEIQRKSFKDNPKNKGKLCTTGPWSLARHINYGCNIVFGFGFGLACGGLPLAVIMGGRLCLKFCF
jgi:steroid 5-alpha reductase family enzyme